MESISVRKSKVLLSGLPGSGKTTLIEKLLAESRVSACGLVTREIREGPERVGFHVQGLSGSREVLAHTRIESNYQVGKYRVDVEALDRTLESEFREGFSQLVVIDEIGKMELLSEQFRSIIAELWKSDQPVIATIMSARNAFCDRLKADKNTMTLELNQQNRGEVFTRLRSFAESLTTIRNEHNK